MDIVTLALAKKYTDNSLAGGGAVRGKNCTIQSKTPIEGGTRITYQWTLDNGTVQTTSVDVMNGGQGVGVESLEIRNGHLFVTLSDGNELDAGAVPVSPGGEVAAITDAELEAMWGD